MNKTPVYTLKKKRKLGENGLVVSIFESSRKPHKKKPYVYNKDASEQLIKIPMKVQKLPTAKSVQLPDFDKLDKLLSSETSTKSLATSFSSLPQDILKGNIEHMNLEKVKEKYHEQAFPLPTSKAALKKRTEKHIELIPRILAGEEELSFYYTLALDQRKKLKHSTMTLQERWDIKWEKYVAGFYGLKRQVFISSLIQNRYKDLLAKSTNKTVKYWTPDMFATYVLANEIILKLVMEDMSMAKPQAEKLLKDTVDYGCKMADEEEFEDDLDFGELVK